jgi:hypothetical protein
MPDNPRLSFADTPYDNSPAGWWTEYGGALDVQSGVVHLPPGAGHPPCPWTNCKRGCRDRDGNPE